METTKKLNFSSVYEKNYNSLLHYVKQRTNNNLYSEDIVAEVFIKANKHFDKFDSEKSKLETWLRVIANNLIIYINMIYNT